jgi:hypothetical protein
MLLITLFLTIFSEPMVRYASVIRLVLVLAAVASITPEAYYFLNGMLDGRDPVAVWTVISDKEEVNNGSGIIDLLDCRLSWHQKTLDESFAVSWTVFSAAEKGNSIRVLIHPGAFSQPWYSDVQVENSRAGNSR